MYVGDGECVAAIRNLIRTAGQHGLQLDEGPTADQPAFSARIGVAHAQRLWAQAVDVLGPALPLQVADSTDTHDCLLHLAAMSCRTMAEVVQLIVAHWRYVTEACRVAVVRDGDSLRLQLEIIGALPLGARLGMEYLLAALVRSGRALSAGAWRPLAIELGHRPPLPLAAWEAACAGTRIGGSE